MKFFQRVVAKIVSQERLSAIRTHSDRWRGSCPKCNTNFSAWDAGAVIWKDVSQIDQGLHKCPNCKKFSLTTLTKTDAELFDASCE